MSLSFSRDIFIGLIAAIIFSYLLFPMFVQADVGHEDSERTHIHCSSGVILYGTNPDCGDDPETSPAPELAQGPPSGTCPTGTAPASPGSTICLPTEEALGIQDDSVGNILLSITLFVTGLIGVLAVLMIVVSGVMYMLSAGDAARAETAKRILTYSIIGLVVALLAWVIVSVVSRVTGAGGLEASNPDGPVTGVEVEICLIPGDSSTCIRVENND